VRPFRLRLAAFAFAAAVALLVLGLTVRARSGDADSRLRAAVAAYGVAAEAGRGFDNGLTRARLRSRGQALLTDVAIGEDREAAAQADVLLGVLAAGGGRSAAGETPDEVGRGFFETAVRLDNGNVAAKFDLELVVRRMRAVGARTGAGQGSGPRGGGRRGAGAGLPGRGY
jgi:hypothetical protein